MYSMVIGDGGLLIRLKKFVSRMAHEPIDDRDETDAALAPHVGGDDRSSFELEPFHRVRKTIAFAVLP